MKIVFFGDSNTWGFEPGTARRQENRFTRLIAKAHPEWEIVEEGLNGRTLAHDDPYSLPRNGARQIDSVIRSHTPYDVLVVMLGSNDAKRMYCTTPGRFENGLHVFLDQATKPSLFRFSPYEAGRILLVQPPMMQPEMDADGMETFGKEGIEMINSSGEIFERAAEIFDVELLRTDGKEPLMASKVDGLHLDELGHQKLADMLTKKLEEMEQNHS